LKVTIPLHYPRCNMRIIRPSLDKSRRTNPVTFKITRLNPLDFFFWGYSKNIVYENAPTTKLDIMNRIKRACEGITPEMKLRSVLENFESRLQLCLRNNGGHFEHNFDSKI